jgi:putative membrane protein
MFTSLATQAAVVCGTPWVGFGFGWLFFLIPLFWIGLFFLIFGLAGRRWRRAAAGGYGPGHGWSQGTRAAEQTLAERYAQGDIDEAEYRARLEVLRANRQNGS